MFFFEGGGGVIIGMSRYPYLGAMFNSSPLALRSLFSESELGQVDVAPPMFLYDVQLVAVAGS